MHLNDVSGVASAFETCGSRMCQTVNNIEYNITAVNQAQSETVRELRDSGRQ